MLLSSPPLKRMAVADGMGFDFSGLKKNRPTS
jgi:hypothetical protein